MNVKLSSKLLNSLFDGKDCEAFPARLVGLRGWTDSDERNRLNIYDDLICLVDNEGFWPFNASVDPGKYWLDHPMNENGCAKLIQGLYWYKQGLHHNHTALVQDGGVDIERLDVFGNSQGVEKNTWIGLNIHSGGNQETVESWSAGCQVIECPEGGWGNTWLKFINLVLSSMNKHGQKRIPYLLCEAFQEFKEKPL